MTAPAARPLPTGAYLAIDAVLDAMPAGVVILDAAGRITLSNAGWRRFVLEQGLPGPDFHLGGDYLDACRRGWFRGLAEIEAFGATLTEVLAGQRRMTTQVFPCRFLDSQRWYRAAVVPLPGSMPAGAIVMHEDISERMSAEERIGRQAFFDGLTDLPNRALLEDRLQQALVRAGRQRQRLAVIRVDLDCPNTVPGHPCGDRVLEQAARRLAAALRESDTIGRLDGRSFAAILPDLARDGDGELVAAKMREALERPFRIYGTEVPVSASIGIARYPADATTCQGLLDQAEHVARRARAAALRESRPRLGVVRPDDSLCTN